MPSKKRVPADNLLLAAMSTKGRLTLTGNRPPVELQFSETLSEPGDRIRHVYFPLDGFISLIAPGTARAQIEIGLVGNEGMLGTSLLLGVDVSPLRALVQGAGRAWRVDAATFMQEVGNDAVMRTALNRYLYVCMSQLIQSAICLRFHLVEARLARWLLMTRDRAHSNRFHITHEFLAYMLGVRRVGVTRAASALQTRNLIRYSRGEIAITDVPGLKRMACTCYATDRNIYRRILAAAPSSDASRIELPAAA